MRLRHPGSRRIANSGFRFIGAARHRRSSRGIAWATTSRRATVQSGTAWSKSKPFANECWFARSKSISGRSGPACKIDIGAVCLTGAKHAGISGSECAPRFAISGRCGKCKSGRGSAVACADER